MPEERPPLPEFSGPGRRAKRSWLGVVELCVLAAVLMGLLVGAPRLMSWWMGPESSRLSAGSDVLLGPNAKAMPALAAPSPSAAAPASALPSLGGQDSTSMVVWGRRRRHKRAAGADGAAGSAAGAAFPGGTVAAGATGAEAAGEEEEDDGPDDGSGPGGVADDGWQRHMGQPQTPAGAPQAAAPSAPAAAASPDMARQLAEGRALANSYMQAGAAGYRQAQQGQMPRLKLQAPQGLGRVTYNNLGPSLQFGGGSKGASTGLGAARDSAGSLGLNAQPTRTLGATAAVIQNGADSRAAPSAAARDSGGGAVSSGGAGAAAAAASAPAGTPDSGSTGGHPPIVTSPTTATSGSTGGTTTPGGTTSGTTTGSTSGTTTGSTSGTTTGSTSGTTTTTTSKAAAAGAGSCFVAGTPVLTPSGPRAIETLRPGDVAYSYDPVTGALVPEKILAGPLPHPGYNIYRVVFENGASFEATSGHPVYGPDGRYRPVGSLSAGDEVLAPEAPSGAEQLALGAPAAPLQRPAFAAPVFGFAAPAARRLRVVSVSRLPVPQDTVYDLSMDGPFHNFLAAGVVVHNLSATGRVASF